MKRDLLKLVIIVIICEAVGIISSLISQSGTDPWFDNINKPDWNPPSWVFAPVWTLLYLAMGIAMWLVWKSNSGKNQKLKAALWFSIQLFFNFWWSILFFRFHSPGLAFIDIILLLFSIAITINLFTRISSKAAWLMVPYFLWVCFATFLNYTIWSLNR